MSDIIKLLPDTLANQIAAGEVIQRPASVVKELLENAVDAKAKSVQLIVKDAGRSLIQVIDDGLGMSEADARMSLERHATSKISNSNDLFNIQTMGFRGEALASIAAVAHLEMKSRSQDRKVGTHLLVEGNKVQFQEVCAYERGTIISVKNLFFNVPARRKFLKSDAVEMRHIIDEFQRVALVNSNIDFKLIHNEQVLFNLPSANVRQRIVAIMGKGYNEKLVPVEEETDLVKITGFIGKPETARKTRGEQFLFVNGRYFKSPYFHSAIQQAYDGLIASKHHPSYFIYFEVNPEQIDVNIHPTKTEIKFEEERNIYAILRASIKRSIGQYHVSPSLDFDREASFDIAPPSQHQEVKSPEIKVNPNFNPFDTEKKTRSSDWERGTALRSKSSAQNWETLYDGLNQDLNQSNEESESESLEFPVSDDNTIVRQIGLKYILVQSEEGIFLLHQYRAHVRLLHEQLEESISNGSTSSQKMLFPVTLELSKQDAELIKELIEPLEQMGFELESFGGNAYIIQATPASFSEINVQEVIAGLIDDLREDKPQDNDTVLKAVVRSLAFRSAIKSGKELKAQEMIDLFRGLMRCKNPQMDLNGRQTFTLISSKMLDKLFD